MKSGKINVETIVEKKTRTTAMRVALISPRTKKSIDHLISIYCHVGVYMPQQIVNAKSYNQFYKSGRKRLLTNFVPVLIDEAQCCPSVDQVVAER